MEIVLHHVLLGTIPCLKYVLSVTLNAHHVCPRSIVLHVPLIITFLIINVLTLALMDTFLIQPIVLYAIQYVLHAQDQLPIAPHVLVQFYTITHVMLHAQTELIKIV